MRVGSKHICLKTRQSWCFTQGLRGHRHVVTDSLRSFSIISGTSDFPLPLHLVLNRLPNYRSRAGDQHGLEKVKERHLIRVAQVAGREELLEICKPVLKADAKFP